MLIKVPVCFSSYNNNIYEDRKTCILNFLCLEPRETDKNVLKVSKNWVLKFHFLFLGALNPLFLYDMLRYNTQKFALFS